MNESNEVRLMTAAEVTEEIFKGKIKYQGILRLTRMGKLPAVKMGKSYLYSEEELKKWMRMNFNTPAWTKIKI